MYQDFIKFALKIKCKFSGNLKFDYVYQGLILGAGCGLSVKFQ